MKVERDIVAPFCVFFIVMGVGGVILLPMAKAIFDFSDDLNKRLFDIAWIAGALTSLLYTIIVLRSFLTQGLTQKAMYVFLVLLFVALGVYPFFR